MKKCKWFYLPFGNKLNNVGAICSHDCPKEMDADCNVIPHKPKMKSIRAWARIDGLGVICTHNYKGDFPYPCHILIATKYLGGMG